MKRILVCTQKMDKDDPVLGFFHRWVEDFAAHYLQVTVICLEKGKVSLPENVKVFSLGKETKPSRFWYALKFYKYVIRSRREYDSVFVHMNQEYILLGGILWRILGKRVGMWRNHHVGNLLTKIAVSLCHITFCTSKFSYIANSKKNVLMPVGIDTEFFKNNNANRTRDILFIARISPVKKPDLLIEAVGDLYAKGNAPSLSLYGSALPKDLPYLENLKARAGKLGIGANFHEGIPNRDTVEVFDSHRICVNLSPSGMYDKTIFEAMACGCLSLSCNKNLVGEIDPIFIFEEDNKIDLASHLEKILSLSAEEKEKYQTELRLYVERNHSLRLLGDKLQEIL